MKTETALPQLPAAPARKSMPASKPRFDFSQALDDRRAAVSSRREASVKASEVRAKQAADQVSNAKDKAAKDNEPTDAAGSTQETPKSVRSPGSESPKLKTKAKANIPGTPDPDPETPPDLPNCPGTDPEGMAQPGVVTLPPGVGSSDTYDPVKPVRSDSDSLHPNERNDFVVFNVPFPILLTPETPSAEGGDPMARSAQAVSPEQLAGQGIPQQDPELAKALEKLDPASSGDVDAPAPQFSNAEVKANRESAAVAAKTQTDAQADAAAVAADAKAQTHSAKPAMGQGLEPVNSEKAAADAAQLKALREDEHAQVTKAIDDLAAKTADLTPPSTPAPAPTQHTAVTDVKAAAPVLTPQTFAQDNVHSIVSSVQTELLPRGGTITMRLDPPELGALQVAVTMKDGIASVSFQSDNPEAVKLLTHTLSELRDTLQTAGMSVDKISVQQSPKMDSPSSDTRGGSSDGRSPSGGQPNVQDENARRDQQRREMLERMWRRVAGDDVNVFA